MTLPEFDMWYKTRFRRTSSALTATAFVFSDMFGVMLSVGWGFFWVRIYYMAFFDYTGISFYSFVTYWPYMPVFVIIFQILSLYPGIALAPAEELRRFSIGSFMAHGGIIMSRYIEKHDWDSITAALIISFVFSTVILLTMRSITHWFLHITRLGGIPAVIYGSGGTGRLVVDRLLGSIRTGYVPALILDNGSEGGADEYRGIPIIHDTSIGPEIVKRYKIRMAMVAMPDLDSKNLKHLMNTSVSAFRYSAYIPDFVSATSIWTSVRDFGGALGLTTSNKLKMSWNLWIKRFLDLAVVIIGGLFILPLLLIIAVLVKVSSPGPVLYGHKRLGMNGKYFTAYKFRSMVIDAHERLQKLFESNPEIKKEWDKNHKLQNDPRVTAIGRFLRRTSMDEFPQLINILKGEMSLVGPRPIVDEEVSKYGEDFNWVFSVKPGMTGMWQVSGRSEADYAARVLYDTYYLQSWSVWLDIWILFMTIGAVLRGKGAY